MKLKKKYVKELSNKISWKSDMFLYIPKFS